jgi:UDP-2,4-diacetamido-2,4,6-trideoxy-beta-L-altropyranose hydrolase
MVNILVRCNAGEKYGMGHLARSLSICKELIEDGYRFIFLIKSDRQSVVEEYLRKFNINSSIFWIKDSSPILKDLEYILKLYRKNNCKFLILDHYNISVNYQKIILSNEINWLQFDSYANQKMYADIVLHASPGADIEKYEKLRARKETLFLLGPKFAAIDSNFGKLRKKVKIRRKIKKIFLCFGGIDPRGITIKIIQLINKEILNKFMLFIAINSRSSQIKHLKETVKELDNIKLLIDEVNIASYMAECDLALISSGVLSYEATCLGLPLVVITILDNQSLNYRKEK